MFKKIKCKVSNYTINNDLNNQRYGDWVDLCTLDNIVLKAGGDALIDLGIAMKLPKGYEAHLLPRSSTFKRTGLLLTNGMGIIDEAYCGNNDTWKVHVYATRDIHVNAGTRLFQFRIVKKQPNLKFVYVSKLKDKDRGGYGSTGA